MRLSTFYRTLLVVLAFAAPLYAQSTSPELERLQAEIAPYVLPAELGTKVIPVTQFNKASTQDLIETMRGYGVEVVASESIGNVTFNISLRNLSLNRILEFVTQQVSAHWLYQDGRVVIFRSGTELNVTYQKAFEHKLALEQQIRTEKRRLASLREETLKEAMILELSVNDATLAQTISQLSMTTVTNGLNSGKGFNIVPLFNRKLYTDTHSYSFKNQSLAHILDTICADEALPWQL